MTLSLLGRGIASLLREEAAEKLRQDTRVIRCGPEKRTAKSMFIIGYGHSIKVISVSA